MSVNIKIQTHHRNPSGFHNKIKWLLKTSVNMKSNLKELSSYIFNRDMYMTFSEKFSWYASFIVANLIIEKSALFNYFNEKAFISKLNLDFLKHECIKRIGDKYKLSENWEKCKKIIDKEVLNMYCEYFSPKECKING